MNQCRTAEKRVQRDNFIMEHCDDMTLNELSAHFDVPTSSIRRIARRLGVSVIKETTKRALPKVGKMSGSIPTLMELREHRNAKPKMDDFMGVFLV